ncbi:hypothetical protein [Geopsychrobacter electrodiphilus]|uniref:hypothetical protein n=1 Tax=Geopsychrobacter electrodiphilus TaxID=225196 RepID=UPI00036AC07A|nr:hypothetical protein [Geopsychrobacter electrodiphilus]
MPSAAFLAAAKAGNRNPVALMAVESIDAIYATYGTGSQWAGSVDLTNIDTAVISGEAVARLSCALTPAGSVVFTYADASHPFYPALADTLSESRFANTINISGVLGVVWPTVEGPGGISSDPHAATWRYNLSKSVGGASVYTSAVFSGLFYFKDWAVPSSGSGDTYVPVSNPIFSLDIALDLIDLSDTPFTAGETLYLSFELLTFVGEGFDYISALSRTYTAGFLSTVVAIADETPAVASVTTSTLDLGVVLGSPAIFQADDRQPYGASITYNILGGNSDPPTVDLGAVSDGQAIGSLGYQYYRVTAEITTSNGARGEINEIRINDAASQFKYFGSHIDQPFAGVMPYLTNQPFGSISSKIELMSPATTGDASVKMVWSRETSDLLATGYLRGKLVYLSMGFAGLPSSDFEPLGVYTWQDYTADPIKQIITVKLRDVFKQFDKIKVPKEPVPNPDGTRTITALTWTNINIIQIILDLFDLVGVPDRMLDRSAFEALRDGTYATTDWNVTRALNNPEEATGLLNELRCTAGLFLVPYRNGKLTPVVYDATATEVANLDAHIVSFGTINGGQKDLYTRQLIYYSPTAGVTDPSSEKDYDKVLVDINPTAETDWNLEAQKVWLDKWNASEVALTALGSRMNDWFAVPRLRLSASKIPLSLMGVQCGQLVTVDNLLLPDVAANWPNTAQGRKFLVLGNSFDPASYSISFDLYDTGQIGAVGPGAVASDIHLSGPVKVWGASNLFVVSGGTAPFTWSSTFGTITDLGSGMINLDVSGLAGAGTLIVYDATSKATKRLSITPPQVLGATIEGNITNAVIEPPAAVVPADLTATIASHFDANAWSSPQEQIDAGYPIYLQPSADGSVYSELFDLGQPLPAGTSARIEIKYTTLAGTLTFDPLLEVSTDGISYTGTEGEWTADVSGQRYLRLQLTITANNNSSLAAITSVRIYLNTED